GTDAGNYTAILSLKDTSNCEWSSTSGATGNTVQVKWTIDKAQLTAVWNSDEHVSDGNEFTPSVVDFVGIAGVDRNGVNFETDLTYEGDMGKIEVGAYSIKAILNSTAAWAKNYVLEGNVDWAYVIVPQEGMQVITIEWQETELVFNGKVQMPTYVVKDKDGNDITEQVKGMLTFGGAYDKSKWADDYQLTVNQPSSTYFIKSGLVCNYSIVIDANGNGYNPNPDENEDNKGGISFDNVGEMLKQWWQVIASGVSIVLIVAFLAKAASYESRRKRANKTADERYKSYYAGAVGLFGLAMTSWTVIACVFIALAGASLVIMIIAKSRCRKAEDNLAYAREDFEHNKAEVEARQRDENMRMMFMSMMGGNNNMGQGMPQGGYAYAQPGIGIEEMRGLISETVTALLPGVQQMLPQQASTNDEVIKSLIEGQKAIMEKLSEQQPIEKVLEREVAVAKVDDEAIKKLMERSEKNDERIEQLMKNQEALIAKLLEKDNAPQIVEKVIEKEIPVEKIVEKVVEVPVEVEKIVE
ncbi:MAG: hypothetical protein K2L61_04035, partial [Clostridia bacterium]|nr:hypothetical protein [Clostridia bacterium]